MKNKKIAISIISLTIIILTIFVIIYFKQIQSHIIKLDFEQAFMMLLFLPGFFIITGLVEAWLPTTLIQKHLGKHSGIKGSVYSFLIGSLMIGPLYLAFPIALVLLKKGISKFNITLFIGAWAAFPVAIEIFEIQFMGLKFFILRALLSIIFVILMSFIMDKMNLSKKNINFPKYI